MKLPKDPFAHPLPQISQSAVGMFQDCRQKYVFHYLMGIRPNGISIPLVTGSAVHKGFEILLDPRNKKLDDVKLFRKLEAGIDSVFDKLLDGDDAVSLPPNTLDKLEKARAQSHAICEAWFVLHSDELDEWEFAATEKYHKPANPRVGDPLIDRMAGKIDGELINSDGELFILDHKTRSNLANLDLIAGLSMDHQALFYIILLNARGKDPVGFIYNLAAKPQHRTGDFPALKRRMYEAILKDPEKYVRLETVYVEDTAVARAAEHLQKTVHMMDNLSPDTVTMSPARCRDYEGCPFIELCQNGADASDPETVQSLPQLDDFFHQDPNHARHQRNATARSTRKAKTTKR